MSIWRCVQAVLSVEDWPKFSPRLFDNMRMQIKDHDLGVQRSPILLATAQPGATGSLDYHPIKGLTPVICRHQTGCVGARDYCEDQRSVYHDPQWMYRSLRDALRRGPVMLRARGIECLLHLAF